MANSVHIITENASFWTFPAQWCTGGSTTWQAHQPARLQCKLNAVRGTCCYSWVWKNTKNMFWILQEFIVAWKIRNNRKYDNVLKKSGTEEEIFFICPVYFRDLKADRYRFQPVLPSTVRANPFPFVYWSDTKVTCKFGPLLLTSFGPFEPQKIPNDGAEVQSPSYTLTRSYRHPENSCYANEFLINLRQCYRLFLPVQMLAWWFLEVFRFLIGMNRNTFDGMHSQSCCSWKQCVCRRRQRFRCRLIQGL